MRQIIAAAALALCVATPAFAQVSPDYPVNEPLSSNPRIRGEQEWWRLVARADAYRTGNAQQAPQQVPVPQHAAINNGASASDAATSRLAGTSPNGAANPAMTSCPGTNEADQPWHPGQYCLPGGR